MAMETGLANVLVPLAVVVLVVFFFTPNRYLGLGMWTLALIAFFLVFLLASSHPSKDWETWVSGIAAVICFSYWVYKRSAVGGRQPPPSASANEEGE
jgi:apolipoprotein N-acyltransferase